MYIDFSMPDKVINHKAQQLLFGYAPGAALGAMEWGVEKAELANEVLFRVWQKQQAGKRVYWKYLVREAARDLKERAAKKGFRFNYRYAKKPDDLRGLTTPINDWRVSQCGY